MVQNRGWNGRGVLLVAFMVMVAVALSACADGADEVAAEPTRSATPTEPEAPASTTPAPQGAPTCAEVWEDGSKIPRGYPGCITEAGEFVARDALGCSSGQTLIRYDNRYYGVVGGTVHDAAQPLDDDPDYRASVTSCRA